MSEGQGQSVGIPLLARSGEVRAFAIVDVADAEMVNQWQWRLLPTGYAGRYENDHGKKTVILLHRFIMGLATAEVRYGPGAYEVDHRNRKILDNRRVNLRVVKHSENLQNRSLNRNSRCGYRGVRWERKTKRWRAQATLNGQRYYLGTFATPEEAGQVAANWRAIHMPFSEEYTGRAAVA